MLFVDDDDKKSMLKSKPTQYKTLAFLKNACNKTPNHLRDVEVTKYQYEAVHYYKMYEYQYVAADNDDNFFLQKTDITDLSYQK